MYHVLIVEDEVITGMSLQLELKRAGYQSVDVATTAEEAIRLFQQAQHDVILMDINLEEGGNGIEAAKAINLIRNVPVIFVTAYANDSTIEAASDTFPYGYVVKPYDIREIKAVIQTALTRFKHDQKIVKSETKLRVAVEAAQIGVMEINRYKNCLTLVGTDYLKKQLKISGVMPLEQFFQLISEQDRERLEPVLFSAQLLKQTVRLRTADLSNPQYFEVFLSDAVLDQGETIIGAVRDVTEQERYLHEMELSDYIFNNMQESVLLLDNNLSVLKVNPALCQVTGFTEDELRLVNFFSLISNNRTQDPDQLQTLLEGREVSVKRKDGSKFFALIAARTVERENSPVNYVIILTDISEIKKTTTRLEEMAYTDELTTLYNRSFMNKVLRVPEQHFPQGRFAAIFIDLDLFKLINDTYGHVAGDGVLKEFSRRLRQLFRATDYLIRHGGDEFIVLVEGAHNDQTISRLVNNIHDVLQAPFVVGSEHVTLTCSIGIAICDNKDDVNAILQQADIAMYEAKNSGRNSHRIYSEHYGEQVRYQLFLEQGLRRAVEQEKLQVWFQPVVDAQSNVIGCEALCRWIDEHAGFVSPVDFIPVAERSWLIMPLGLLVFKRACEYAVLLRNTRNSIKKINVNLSPKQVASAALPNMLQNMLDEHGLSASYFMLEITENVLQSEESIQTLLELRELGFDIALDDFGTGYSNFARLRKFPLDIIKIDKSLVQGRFVDEEQRIVCDSVLTMCRQLGFTIVVEGIETQQQADYFREFSDVLQQGYFHGKPQPVNDSVLSEPMQLG